MFGEEEGTAEHFFVKGFTQQFKATGFKDSEGQIDIKQVEIAKRRLSDWWLKPRQKGNLVFHYYINELRLGGVSHRSINRVQPHPSIHVKGRAGGCNEANCGCCVTATLLPCLHHTKSMSVQDMRY